LIEESAISKTCRTDIAVFTCRTDIAVLNFWKYARVLPDDLMTDQLAQGVFTSRKVAEKLL
jgi:hypothetical protein